MSDWKINKIKMTLIRNWMDNKPLILELIRGWVLLYNRRDAAAVPEDSGCSSLLKYEMSRFRDVEVNSEWPLTVFREIKPKWIRNVRCTARHARAYRTRVPRQMTVTSACAWRIDASKSTKGASKLRRDLINAEIANLRDLLPLPPSTRQRLSQLQLMALVCVFLRKANYFQQGMANGEFAHAFKS